MSAGNKLLKAAAGNAAGGAVYVDDLFATFLYDGNQTARSINNGIDLDGEGGLVWTKERSDTTNHYLYDTERGALSRIFSNETNSASSIANSLTSFNSDGFSLGTGGSSNANNENYVSWTFRKQPGFFDVVTYTGNSTSGRAVSHNLGSAPGFMMVKCTSDGEVWRCFHRTQGANKSFQLNSDQARSSDTHFPTAPDADNFYLGVGNQINGSGKTYVAYLFAHNAEDFGEDSDEAIIKCGNYSGNGSSTGPTVDLGFEPQWILAKRTDNANSWWIVDTQRGIAFTRNEQVLFPDSSGVEDSSNVLTVTPTGFQLKDSGARVNASGGDYLFVAIRRPHKPASEFTAADMFYAATRTGTDSDRDVTGTPFPVDVVVSTATNQQLDRAIGFRGLSRDALFTNLSGTTFDRFQDPGWDLQNGVSVKGDLNKDSGFQHIDFFFKRVPGFMDVVTYTGTGSSRTINHNLGAVPQLMLVKGVDAGFSWDVYVEAVGNTKKLSLNSSGAVSTADSEYWNNTTPTASVFSLGDGLSVNNNNSRFINFLFASTPGISKVGSYTGTGSTLNIDCGFSSGAKFVLIKRTDGTGGWYQWDYRQGIVAGNDPYLFWNGNSAATTDQDYIDPLNAGFTLTSSAPSQLNNNGGSYIFLAIA